MTDKDFMIQMAQLTDENVVMIEKLNAEYGVQLMVTPKVYDPNSDDVCQMSRFFLVAFDADDGKPKKRKMRTVWVGEEWTDLMEQRLREELDSLSDLERQWHIKNNFIK